MLNDGDEVTQIVDERWVCAYESRSGGRARAIFASHEQARDFAERHARLSCMIASPIKWTEVDGSWVLRTENAEYVIIPLQ